MNIHKASPSEKSGIKNEGIVISIDGAEIEDTGVGKKEIDELKCKPSYLVTVLPNNQIVQTDTQSTKKTKSNRFIAEANIDRCAGQLQTGSRFFYTGYVEYLCGLK